MSIYAPADILLPLFATWAVVTVALGYGAHGIERAIIDIAAREPLGPEFWLLPAGGGAAVGGLVALSSVAQFGTAFEPAHYATIVTFSLANVVLVAAGRWFVEST